jgi:hypothetical protein
MRQALLTAVSPRSKLGAWVCLVAALLLWAPLWAPVWLADGMNCCVGGMCPVHQHAKHSQDYANPNNSSEPAASCEHHGERRMAPCSMSCDHREARTFVASIAFVLPQTVVFCGAPRSLGALQFSSEHALRPNITPPDQPPRLLLS